MKKNIAVIGAGISGLSIGQMLISHGFDVTVYEKENKPGGLIRCERINGNLFHICGGHVFNSKKPNVLDWFWNRFQREKEFTKAIRKSVIFMENGEKIPYPIENHMYLFNTEIQRNFINDLLKVELRGVKLFDNFEDFLKGRFGETLYKLYFQPYNYKIWKRDLKNVPISWLEGKLPMPSVEDMIYNNMNHVDEKEFVHSTFYYEKENGSQFIADRLAENLHIVYSKEIVAMEVIKNGILVDGATYDMVIFCGNIKKLPMVLKGIDMGAYTKEIDGLEYHGTTSVFCSIDNNPYSWIYLPSMNYDSHRIICTGNFSPTNNTNGMMTATIEFTDYLDENCIKDQLVKMPLRPHYITHHYNEFTYPIQNNNTRELIHSLKGYLESHHIYITGRFADWEYYNMDVAIEASMKTYNKICKRDYMTDIAY